MSADVAEFMAQSSNVFFRPTPAWWELLGNPWLRWRRHIDAGAGVGALTKAMRERGYDVEGIELHPRDAAVTELRPGSVLEQFYGADDCVILARPCHGDFVERVVREHQEEAGVIIYVSRERNVESDLQGIAHRELARHVGEEGEVAVQLFGMEDDVRLYAKCSFHAADPGHWRQVIGDKLVNDQGGWCPYDGHFILEHRGLMRGDQIPREFEQFVKTPDDHGYDANGWVDPEGRFYATGHYGHDEFIECGLGISVRRAELLGFVRCREEKGRTWYNTGDDYRPNAKQVRTLRKQGFKITGLGGDLE